MAKQELNWVNVNASSLTGNCLKAYNTLQSARDAFKRTMVDEARKADALAKDETLVINHKAWGFGMAKVAEKGSAKASGKDVFGSL